MAEDEDHRPFERYIQLVAGLAMWAFLMYQDDFSGDELLDSSVTSGNFWFGVMKYTVAFILIKGVSMGEIQSLLRAWKGKE